MRGTRSMAVSVKSWFSVFSLSIVPLDNSIV
jgi:hypothetical protein